MSQELLNVKIIKIFPKGGALGKAEDGKTIFIGNYNKELYQVDQIKIKNTEIKQTPKGYKALYGWEQRVQFDNTLKFINNIKSVELISKEYIKEYDGKYYELYDVKLTGIKNLNVGVNINLSFNLEALYNGYLSFIEKYYKEYQYDHHNTIFSLEDLKIGDKILSLKKEISEETYLKYIKPIKDLHKRFNFQDKLSFFKNDFEKQYLKYESLINEKEEVLFIKEQFYLKHKNDKIVKRYDQRYKDYISYWEDKTDVVLREYAKYSNSSRVTIEPETPNLDKYMLYLPENLILVDYDLNLLIYFNNKYLIDIK